MPVVSVIIPNYNHASFLDQRIDSVLNQTFQDFEVIILDDCSTDDSRNVIEKYRNHPKISQIIFNEVNSGSPFKQWEKGITLAQGEWVWIAESDDWCETNFLSELISAINYYSSQSISVAFCQSFLYQNETGDLGIDFRDRKILNYIKRDQFVENRMLPRPSILNSSMAIFKKVSYLSIPKDFENYKFCGDWLFWIEIGKTGDTVEIGKLLNYHRVHRNNTYSTNSKKGKTFSEELQIIDVIKLKGWASKEVIDDSIRVYYKLLLHHKKKMSKITFKEVQSLFGKAVNKNRLIKYEILFFVEKCLNKSKILLERIK